MEGIYHAASPYSANLIVRSAVFRALQHVVEVEGGEDAPIMEIREWLDESGEQTSVDVTDLGKVRDTHDTQIPCSGQCCPCVCAVLREDQMDIFVT